MAGEKPTERFLPKRIEYLGNLSSDELAKYYKISQLYLALPIYDTFGTRLTEAAFSSCAIIANNIPFYRELWGDSACIFETNSINSLIRSINNLVENEYNRVNIAKKCQIKALSAYNSKRMAVEYINLYKHFMQKNQAKKNIIGEVCIKENTMQQDYQKIVNKYS